MKDFTIGKTIRTRRTKLGLTLKQLALELGINYQRLSEIERDEHLPSEPLLGSLAKRLKISLWESNPAIIPYSIDEAKKYHRTTRYRVKHDRPASVRIAAAWQNYPKLMAYLKPRLPRWARSDVNRIRLDSCLELVAVYLLIVAGAIPVRVKTLSCGMRVHAVVEPDTRLAAGHCFMSALSLRGVLFIHQVTLLPTQAKSIETCDL